MSKLTKPYFSETNPFIKTFLFFMCDNFKASAGSFVEFEMKIITLCICRTGWVRFIVGHKPLQCILVYGILVTSCCIYNQFYEVILLKLGKDYKLQPIFYVYILNYQVYYFDVYWYVCIYNVRRISELKLFMHEGTYIEQ